MRHVLRIGALVLAVLGWLAVPARAQVQTGEIFGHVADSTGAVLPGVIVTLESPALIRPQSNVTTASGGYRFPNIPAGDYRLKFELTGFKTLVREGVRVQTGFNAEINPRLELSTVEETVTVSGESPIVDTRQVKAGETFTREMLEHLPSARDPWVILEQTPGIVMDRQNVGGSESGQQSSFTVHGGNTGNSMWNVDGVTITDMAATGASPTYYDFDSFAEIQVQTAGNDASLQTGGVNLNLITKSGSNRFRGSGRFFGINDSLQSNNVTEALFEEGASSGNPIQNIRDFGGEIGGPIVRDRAWFWGGYGKQDIRVGVVDFFSPTPGCEAFNVRANQSFDKLDAMKDCLEADLTELENYNAKLQYQPVTPHKFTFLYTRGDKIRSARGASATTRPESTFRQSGPTNLYKGSWQWIASDRMTVETQYAYTAGGFVLDFQRPELEETQRLLNLDTSVLSRSGSRSGPFDRPQTEVKSDINYFLTDWLGGDHSLKAGVRWRDTPFSSESHVGGNATARVRNTAGGGLRPSTADLHRDSNAQTAMSNVSAYVNNSYTRDRFTVNVGLRVDHQDDEALASTIPANPLIPDLLPSVAFQGADSGVTYTDWSPRLGVTYDLFGTGKTVLKASAAVYYGQGIFTAGQLNPVGSTTLRFDWSDANGDLLVQPGELGDLLSFSSNYDPSNPSSLTTNDTVDPNLSNDRTREVIAGVDHELVRNFAVGVKYIFRRYDDFSRDDTIGLEPSDYVPVQREFECGNDSCDQDRFRITYFQLPFRIPSAEVLTSDPFFRNFNGLELTARKRYNGRWMMNGSVALGSTIGHFPTGSFEDPTQIPFVDGAQDNSRNARWIAKLSGMYSFPFQINGSMFLNAREGFPFFRSIRTPNRAGAIGRINAKFERDGESRYENLVALDFRVEKWFDFRGMQAAASFDLFNSFNEATVLDREGRQNLSTANRIEEIIAPRVARLGVRFKF